MVVDRGTGSHIISRWIGIFAGLGFLVAAGYGAFDFIQGQGGGANPFDMALEAATLGVIGGIAGGVFGAVWGAITAVISR